jgi:CxxC motif-containing protein
MEETKQLICIGCPMGCPMEVVLKEGAVVSVTGNTCGRGKTYSEKEVVNPTRVVTGTVFVRGSKTGAITVPCKTKTDIKKGKIMAVMQEIASVCIDAPVNIGDIIVKNVADTGTDIVATANIK